MADPSGDVQTLQRLNNVVRGHPGGISISKLSRETGINRNSVAKYLEIMLAAGQVEMKTVGAAKVFFHSKKIPLLHIADNFPEIIIIVDSSGKVFLANQSCNAFFGHSSGELAGKPLKEALLPGMPAQFFEAVQAGIAGARADDVFVVERNGNKAYLNGKFIPVALEAGKDGLFIFLEDITEERRSKILLEESESKFRTLFNNSCAMIFVHPLSHEGEPGRFIEVNSFACEKLGYSREELLSMTVTDLLRVPPSITEGSKVAETLQKDECLQLERHIYDRNGNKIPVEIYSHLIDLDGRKVVLSILLDRTYKLKYEDKILENLKNMEYLSQMALSFLDYPEDEDPYGFVADQLCAMCPGALVMINTVDECSGKWQNKALRGLKRQESFLTRLLTFLSQTEYGTFEKGNAAIVRAGRLMHFTSTSFLESFNDAGYRALIEMMVEEGYEECYAMALLRDVVQVGIVAIAVPRGYTLERPELVEAFLNQAGVALGKRNADLSLKQANKTLMQKLVEHERQMLKFQEILNISTIESREIEKSLHVQTGLTRRCLELMNIALVTVHENGTIMGVNTSACDMLTRSQSELIGKNWFEDVLCDTAAVRARNMHQKIAQNPRYSGILRKPVNCNTSGKKEMVWMIRKDWESSNGGTRILWIGEEMPADRVLELSQLT